MDEFLEFSVSNWGITLSSAPLYFNLSWGLIVLGVGLAIARKILKARRG